MMWTWEKNVVRQLSEMMGTCRIKAPNFFQGFYRLLSMILRGETNDRITYMAIRNDFLNILTFTLVEIRVNGVFKRIVIRIMFIGCNLSYYYYLITPEQNIPIWLKKKT